GIEPALSAWELDRSWPLLPGTRYLSRNWRWPGATVAGSVDRCAISVQLDRVTKGSITATPGRPRYLVTGSSGHDLSNSQADSAGSIPSPALNLESAA